jgi:hypothetical protein
MRCCFSEIGGRMLGWGAAESLEGARVAQRDGSRGQGSVEQVKDRQEEARVSPTLPAVRHHSRGPVRRRRNCGRMAQSPLLALIHDTFRTRRVQLIRNESLLSPLCLLPIVPFRFCISQDCFLAYNILRCGSISYFLLIGGVSHR